MKIYALVNFAHLYSLTLLRHIDHHIHVMLEAILTPKIPLFGRLEYINKGFGGVLFF